MGQATEVGLSGSCMTARRVFDADTVLRLRGMNTVSRLLRALGFAVDAETLMPFDGGLPVIVLRAVPEDGQRILHDLGAITTFHVGKHLRTAVLGGARLAWEDCAARG